MTEATDLKMLRMLEGGREGKAGQHKVPEGHLGRREKPVALRATSKEGIGKVPGMLWEMCPFPSLGSSPLGLKQKPGD